VPRSSQAAFAHFLRPPIRKYLAPRAFCRFEKSVIPWRKVPSFIFAVCAFAVLALRAQTDKPVLPDPLGVRAALAAAEKQHADTYAASKFAEAIVASRAGLGLADRSGTLADQVQFIRHLAYDYWLMGDNDSAIEYSQRLLDCAELLGDNRLRAQSHRYLSQVYETMDDDARARSHADSALRFAQLAGDEDVRIYALTSVGLSEARARHYDAALRAFEESRTYWEKQRRPWNAVNSLVNLADVIAARGDLPAALQRYEEILAARVQNNDRSGQVRAVAAIANLLRRLGRADEALPRLVAARSLAEAIGSHRVLAEFYNSLAQVHEARGDFAAALATERLAANERNQLASDRARLRSSELEARLELLQKQEAINQLRSAVAVNEARLRTTAADLAQVRSFRIAVIDGVAAFAVIVAAAYLVWRYRARSKRLHAAVAKALQAAPLGELPPPGP
jgi:tetratricopeptide (TPR) repeat protein